MFRQPEQGGHDMTAEVPFPRCQQVCALAGDGVVFKEGAPFPWHEGATGFPRCMLLGPQQLSRCLFQYSQGYWRGPVLPVYPRHIFSQWTELT